MSLFDDVLATLKRVEGMPPPPRRVRVAPDVWDRLHRESYENPSPAYAPSLGAAAITGIPVAVDSRLSPGEYKVDAE